MKFTKLYLSILAVFGLQFATLAQWVTGSVASGNQTIVDTGAGQLVYLQLSETAGTATTVVVYDLASTTTTNRVIPGYTGRLYYMTNIVTTWTDSVGVSRSKTNTTQASVPLVVAASTNSAAVIYQVRIPANGSVVFDPPVSLGYINGLTIRSVGSSIAFNSRIIGND